MYRLGRDEQAQMYLTESYRTLARSKGVHRETLAKARARVVRFYTERNQVETLQAIMAAVEDARRAVPPG